VARRETKDLLKIILTPSGADYFTVLAVTSALGLTARSFNSLATQSLHRKSQVRRTHLGTLLLGVGCAVPLVGWFLPLLIYTPPALGIWCLHHQLSSNLTGPPLPKRINFVPPTPD